MSKRLIGTLIILIGLGIGIPVVGGVQLGDVDGTVNASTASPPVTNGSTPLEAGTERSAVIIVFENDTAREAAAFPDWNVTVTGGHDIDFMPVLYASVPTEAIDALERRPNVQAVYRDSRVSNPDDDVVSETRLQTQSDGQVTPWGIDRIDAPEANNVVEDAAKANVTVAVLDTGIDYTHPDLDETVSWGGNFTYGTEMYRLSTAMDNNGHGTAVAGVIAAEDNNRGVIGVAPETNLYAVKVLNSDGRGKFNWVISGIEAAISGPDGKLGTDDDADVLSMSFGDDKSNAGLEDIIEYASEYTVVISAAGNSGNGDTGDSEVLYPAKYTESIAVAATDRQNQTPVWSAEGPNVELAAPGVEITTTALNNGTSVWNGTSFAAPHVSGVAALVVAHDLADGTRDLSNQAVRNRLRNATLDIEADGVDSKSGYGLILADEAVDIDPAERANFSVADLSPGEIHITTGTSLNVSATVTNVGDTGGTQSVSLILNGTVVSARERTLDAGKSTSVSFVDVFGDRAPGVYRYGVQTENDSQMSRVRIESPTDFTVTALSPESISVVRGESVNVSATIENVGSPGTRNVQFLVDNRTIDTATVTLDNGANTTIPYVIDTEELALGTHTLTVSTKDVNRSTTITVATPAVTRTLSSSTPAPGEAVTVTLTTTTSSSEISITENFSPSFATADVERVAVDGESTYPIVGVADSDGVVVLTDVPNGANVSVTYSIHVDTDAPIGQTHTIAGWMTDEKRVPTVEQTITVTEETSLEEIARAYDADGNGTISIGELGAAAADYANGVISITDLGTIAAAYANA